MENDGNPLNSSRNSNLPASELHCSAYCQTHGTNYCSNTALTRGLYNEPVAGPLEAGRQLPPVVREPEQPGDDIIVVCGEPSGIVSREVCCIRESWYFEPTAPLLIDIKVRTTRG
jgi:hypothetical protein